MLALNCSCFLYTFLTWLQWVEGIMVSGSSLNYPPLPIPTVTLQHLHWLELQLQGALIFPEPVTPFTLPLSIFFFFFIFDVDISPEFSTGSKYVWSWLWYIDILINCMKCNIFGYFLLVFLVHVVNIYLLLPRYTTSYAIRQIIVVATKNFVAMFLSHHNTPSFLFDGKFILMTLGLHIQHLM